MTNFSRRSFLRLAAACASVGLAACARASAPSPGGSVAATSPRPAGAASSAATLASPAWDQTVAQAKQEGQVAIMTAPGDGIRLAFMEFQKTYGIQVNIVTGAGTSDLVPRVKAERQAGQYLWDVAVSAPVVVHSGFKPLGALDPLRPALIAPGVTDDAKWARGFDGGWVDRDKTSAYSFVHYLTWNVWVNRGLVPAAQLNKLEQLWQPEWKGKIAMQDPRSPSAGSGVLGIWLYNKDEAKLRSFLQTAQPTLTQNGRQLADWLVKGQYPISIGLNPATIEDFSKAGVDLKPIQPLTDEDPAAIKVSDGTGTIGLFNRAPHPNAAKVFVNWLLSQQGQTVYAQQSGYNVRRLDAPVVDADKALDPSKEYFDPQTEANNSYETRAIAIAKEELK